MADPVQPQGHALEICPIFSTPAKVDAQGRVVTWNEEPCREARCMFYRRRDGVCTLTFVADVSEEVADLRDEQRHTAAELERLLAETGRRAEQSTRVATDSVRADLSVELRRLQADLADVKRTQGGLESNTGESRAALVELVEYDRQRRQREEAEREKREREARKAEAAALQKQARSHFRTGRREESVAALSTARDLDPDSAELLSDLGAALVAVGRLDQAEEPLRRAVRASDTLAAARVNLGQYFLLRGEPGEAVTVLEEAVRLDPASAAGWNGLGNARWRLGRFRAALEAWHRAWDLDPLCESARVNLLRQQELD